jgi:hypothetical protein
MPAEWPRLLRAVAPRVAARRAALAASEPAQAKRGQARLAPRPPRRPGKPQCGASDALFLSRGGPGAPTPRFAPPPGLNAHAPPAASEARASQGNSKASSRPATPRGKHAGGIAAPEAGQQFCSKRAGQSRRSAKASSAHDTARGQAM